MKFMIIIYTTNKLTVVEMEDIRGVRLRKFNLRKIVLGVRMHFHHSCTPPSLMLNISDNILHHLGTLTVCIKNLGKKSAATDPVVGLEVV